MNKLKYMAGAVLAAIAISSCSEDTEAIGHSLTSEADKLVYSNNTFYATSNTYLVDSLMTRQSYCYLGRVIDPETETEVSSSFTTQFYLLPNVTIPYQYISSKENGEIVADSCDIIMYLYNPFKTVDNKVAVQMNIHELKTPVREDIRYYSNFMPDQYLRTDANAINFNHMFSYDNMTDNDKDRSASSYLNNIRVPLNQQYVGLDSVTYKNYGTYILRKLIKYQTEGKKQNPNTYVFSHEVCPGFSFTITDGYGFHSAYTDLGLRIYYNVVKPDTSYKATFIIASTDEVMQTISVSNDKTALTKLAAETDHTYLKTPAGLFTEVKLPVEQIWNGHESDSLLATKVTFQRMNNQKTNERAFDPPASLLMVMKDSLKTYFETKQVPNSKTSYVTSYNSTYNTYSFSNIANLVTRLWKLRNQHIASDPTWADPNSDHYKVLLVPVEYGTSTTSTTPTWIGHDLSLSSTRLVGGKTPIELNVVYARFKK